MAELINPQPRLLSSTTARDSPLPLPSASQDALRDELFSLVRRINDPEHPHTLEELGVVDKAHIWFSRPHRPRKQRSGSDDANTTSRERWDGYVDDDVIDGEESESDETVIELTPTVPHCSLATTIGLCIRHKVESSIPNIKLQVRIRDGTHRTAAESQTRNSTRQAESTHSNNGLTPRPSSWLVRMCYVLTAACLPMLAACVRCSIWVLCEVSKQLNDKERCCAAMENPAIADIVLQLTKDRAE